MKKKRAAAPKLFDVRIQSLTREVENLVVELKAGPPAKGLLAPSARSLERAAKALRAVTEEGKPVADYADLRAVLEGTSPLMSQLGSRVVLAALGAQSATKPSSGAQALAFLLEEPGRSVDAGTLATQLGCSVPMARTTLNRLVQSGHAVRASRGNFRAKD